MKMREAVLFADHFCPARSAEKVYPEPWMFGTIPAKGFYIRHAKNITFDGVRFHFAQPDGRPLFVTDDAENIEYYHTPQE